MKKLRFVISTLIILPAFFSPMMALAVDADRQNPVADRASGLVVCGNSSASQNVLNQCTFEDVIKQIQVIISFLLFKIASPLAAIMFAYAGFLYLTNAGNESRIKEAHEIFWNVFIGLVVALSAWLLVNFILTFLLGEGSAFNFLKAS